MADKLITGERLNRGSELISPNGEFKLAMQYDGNLVVYRVGSDYQKAVWASDTWELPPVRRPTYVEMQTDGNLVLYNDARVAAWASGVWDQNTSIARCTSAMTAMS